MTKIRTFKVSYSAISRVFHFLWTHVVWKHVSCVFQSSYDFSFSGFKFLLNLPYTHIWDEKGFCNIGKSLWKENPETKIFSKSLVASLIRSSIFHFIRHLTLTAVDGHSVIPGCLSYHVIPCLPAMEAVYLNVQGDTPSTWRSQNPGRVSWTHVCVPYPKHSCQKI